MNERVGSLNIDDLEAARARRWGGWKVESVACDV